jgi:predicted nucleic-acid-binding protein
MNHLNEISTHSERLPEHLQKEVLDFIYFLEARYSFKSIIQPKQELTDEEIEQTCGILQAPHSITLEQMDEAIKKRGGGVVIAVDTNILVRLLINEPDSQTQVGLAKALLKRAKQVYVPQTVQIEMVWVLETAYGFNKPDVITALKHLQQSFVFVLQDETQFDNALENFENYTAYFSDYLILSGCLENNHEVFTFDKKFARLQSVKLLDEKLL